MQVPHWFVSNCYKAVSAFFFPTEFSISRHCSSPVAEIIRKVVTFSDGWGGGQIIYPPLYLHKLIINTCMGVIRNFSLHILCIQVQACIHDSWCLTDNRDYLPIHPFSSPRHVLLTIETPCLFIHSAARDMSC